ncbi:MerR family DNA-binding transcriptional regulator [Amycolatopsis sp. NPDC006131]|uniref:MerR family DNA-binding transcriptional regulator n=1 Tax=Amycolatopsis sp. NPDC006131 TaxID=3156731 RepID=UPI0033B83A73
MALLTSSQLAKALDVSRQSIARWAKDGMITPEFVTPGGQYRWDLEKVKAELRRARQNE